MNQNIDFSWYLQQVQKDIQKLIQQVGEIEKKIVPQEELLTRKDAASFLKCCLRTIDEFKSNGTLPYIQIGRKIYFKRQDLISVIQNNRHEF